jgi:DNA replication regulator SLD3
MLSSQNDARQTRQTLTPLSDLSHDLSDGGGLGGKKRKRDGNTMEDLLKDSFTIRVAHSYPLSVHS